MESPSLAEINFPIVMGLGNCGYFLSIGGQYCNIPKGYWSVVLCQWLCLYICTNTHDCRKYLYNNYYGLRKSRYSV